MRRDFRTYQERNAEFREAISARDWVLRNWRETGARAVAQVLLPKVNPNITKNIDLTINRTLIIMLFKLFIPYFYIIFIKNKFI